MRRDSDRHLVKSAVGDLRKWNRQHCARYFKCRRFCGNLRQSARVGAVHDNAIGQLEFFIRASVHSNFARHQHHCVPGQLGLIQ